MSNVNFAKRSNGSKRVHVNSRGFPYDYDSIMHYTRTHAAKTPGLETIVTKKDPVTGVRPQIGVRMQLSEGDIAQTNAVYKCPSKYQR